MENNKELIWIDFNDYKFEQAFRHKRQTQLKVFGMVTPTDEQRIEFDEKYTIMFKDNHDRLTNTKL